MFKGATVAMVTPFEDNLIDIKAVTSNVNFYIENKINGILIAGTTGEGPTLSTDDYKKLTSLVIEKAEKKVNIMLNVGTNSTDKTLKNLEFANSVNIDSVLIITPYYNKPNYSGMLKHFEKVSQNTNLPIYIYNVPGRTGINIDLNIIKELSNISNIVGIKEASGDIDRVSSIVLNCKDDFEVLSGDDSLTLPAMAVGAKGVISVTANIVPQKISDMVRLALENSWTDARKIHFEIYNLSKTLFIETNPVPIKAAMSLAGKCSNEVRSPLGKIKEENLIKLKSIMESLKII